MLQLSTLLGVRLSCDDHCMFLAGIAEEVIDRNSTGAVQETRGLHKR